MLYCVASEDLLVISTETLTISCYRFCVYLDCLVGDISFVFIRDHQALQLNNWSAIICIYYQILVGRWN
jgi:hypothetical protein